MIRIRTTVFATISALLCAPVWAGPDAMTTEEARHLISRTGFGAAPHEIAEITGLSYAGGVEKILNGLHTTPVTPMPDWASGWAYPGDQIWTLGQTQSELYSTNRWLELTELSSWWIAEMAATPSPLSERLVLFWSDHFANSFEDHENSQWMAQQNQFLRANAAGDFTTLAHGMLLDPAMLTYLDNVSNVADAPNENLGREFLELFTLGEGRGYTQDDVRAAARMLTGYGVNDLGSNRMMFEAEEHDFGPKTIFGQTGPFDADDLVTLTLAHPEFGPYIVEKLWLTFVSDVPDPVEIERLTQVWKDNGLQIEPLLEAMFLTDAFWDPANRGRLIKSPVELVVGTTRTLGLTLPNAQDIVWMVSELNQPLFLPPNVGGWPEGVEWINDATASARATMLTYLLYGAVDEGEVPYPLIRTPMMSGISVNLLHTPMEPDDLRVGQVFATYVEQRPAGEGYGGSFTLFDVGFKGQDWRSISFWLEYNEEDDFASLYLYNGDCTPVCLGSLPGDGDGWLAFEPWEGMLDEYPPLAPQDLALMQAIGTHLPDLIATTQSHQPFRDDPFDPQHQPARIEPLMEAARLFAKNSAAQIGQNNGALIQAFSRVDALGLAGSDMLGEFGDMDAYRDAQEQAAQRPMVARVTYQSSRAWFDALQGSGPEGARGAKVLLAVPTVSDSALDALQVDDPDAVLRRLVLSPEFQVN